MDQRLHFFRSEMSDQTGSFVTLPAGLSGASSEAFTLVRMQRFRLPADRHRSKLFMRAFAGFALILILLAASPAPGAEPRPRSILVLDQSDPTGPLFREIFTGFLAVLR